MTKRKTTPHLKRGRKSDFREEYCEQAYKLCLLGATDRQLADFFSVSEQTVNKWKEKHPKFIESLKLGKDEADSRVAKSLFSRANGYSHPEEKIFQYEGEIVRADTIKHYPPDTTACIFWLKNRQKEAWRDKHEVDNKSSDGSMTPQKIEIVIVKPKEQ